MITSIDQLDLSKQYTYADYLAWQFAERVELIRGYLLKMAAPNSKHQGISTGLSREIFNFFKQSPCKAYAAPFDVRLVKNAEGLSEKEMYTVVQPDICVICDKTKIDKRGCKGAPDWIIEIVSKASLKTDTQIKFELYQENGVREYWIVRPHENTIEQFALENEKYQFKGLYTQQDSIHSYIFPDLHIDLSEVFED